MPGTRRALGLLGPVSTAALAASAVAYIVTKNPHIPGSTFICPIAALTGLYCPGCGGTRAVYDLAHGDIGGALSMNPLVTLAIPLVAVLWTRWLLRGVGMPLREWRLSFRWPIALPVVVVAFTVLRNLPPFAPYLAP
jgi:hypothetical protein